MHIRVRKLELFYVHAQARFEYDGQLSGPVCLRSLQVTASKHMVSPCGHFSTTIDVYSSDFIAGIIMEQ